jgi:hypothetical protein
MPADKLTPKQKAFVAEFVANGANMSEAARRAGYSLSSAPNSGHRLMKLPHVVAAIKAEAERMLNANVIIGAQTIVDLARNAESESVRLQAGQSLLDRGGLPFIRQSENRIVVEDRRTDDELLASAKAIAKELGLDAKLVDGHVVADLPVVIDQKPEHHDVTADNVDKKAEA